MQPNTKLWVPIFMDYWLWFFGTNNVVCIYDASIVDNKLSNLINSRFRFMKTIIFDRHLGNMISIVHAKEIQALRKMAPPPPENIYETVCTSTRTYEYTCVNLSPVDMSFVFESFQGHFDQSSHLFKIC